MIKITVKLRGSYLGADSATFSVSDDTTFGEFGDYLSDLETSPDARVKSPEFLRSLPRKPCKWSSLAISAWMKAALEPTFNWMSLDFECERMP